MDGSEQQLELGNKDFFHTPSSTFSLEMILSNALEEHDDIMTR
ncbi:MAG: hypothetical protein AB2693_15515 [Candidatus Thiodiazotropha sp.]